MHVEISVYTNPNKLGVNTMKEYAPKLQTYLRKTFGSNDIRVIPHPKKNDMAEVFIGNEFLAPLYREEDEGEVCYQFQMAILDIDLNNS
ncbi:MAG: hypothetical protein TECD_00272 [Hyphomicrobiaceae bacterium hypho_1]